MDLGGGDSRWMRGVACAEPGRYVASTVCLCSGACPFAFVLGPGTFFCRGAYGRGPFSTTQSLRSIDEVLRPSAGGEADVEREGKLLALAGGDGVMGK